MAHNEDDEGMILDILVEKYKEVEREKEGRKERTNEERRREERKEIFVSRFIGVRC